MSLGLMMIKCEIIYRSNYEYASFKQNNSSKKKTSFDLLEKN